MLPAALLLAVLAVEPAPLPSATNQTRLARFQEATPDAIAAIVKEIAALPELRARVLSASERFLGVPYKFEAFGEGPGIPPDEDPRLRWDLTDCQTYVETVIALTRAKSAASVLPILDDIRYDGEPAYAHRNHFFEGQWIPVNTRKGYVRSITRMIAGKDLIEHVKSVSPAQWKERTVAQNISLPDERAPIGKFPLPYLPLAKVLAHAAEIPSGTIFVVVREDREKTPTMVTHLGLIVQKDGATCVRHAGLDLYGQVVDEDLAHFVERNLTYTKWPVLGLSFLEILEGERR